MATKSILDSALNGGRASRNGDLVIVAMPNQGFVTTAQEYQIVMSWARSKQSNGLPHKDRAMMLERFETLIPRNNSGLAARGNRKVLKRMVDDMEQLGMMLEDWTIPRDLDDDGMKPRKKIVAADGTETEVDDDQQPEEKA
ncbi:hypothetical protein [Stenotrophobium rhamnosiphilum]|uniref:hypothetical protein n=1 Tax=Stenotrophobium rhamnosiphilum TaxID=2029166 RepID=UPI0011B27AB1|nr:hypothetical protein [Stenotrophobium rhamnosiphilum]